jgi:hypothetical protein
MSNVIQQRPPSYAYNASAAALGGVITRKGRSTVVPTIGSVCLSMAGGEASNSVENYHRDDISFAHAQTRVSGYSTSVRGSRLSRRYLTYADVLISKLQVFDRMKINFMQATVMSERVIETGDPLLELVPDLSRFSIRLFYHGVEIDGEEVLPDVDLELCHAGSYADFLRLLPSRMGETPDDTQEFFEALRGESREAEGPDEIVTVGKRRRPENPPVNVPLLSLRGNGKDKDKIKGNRVKVPSFGRARFGDAIVKPDRQRVSLINLNLDSDWSTTPPRDERFESEPQSVTFKAEGEQQFAVLRDPVAAPDDGGGGAIRSGDSGSNGVPVWP